jgi:DNA-directed RNA polymerase subunit RPC12/RpoP
MDLITAKCPECGADLKVLAGQDVITCEYCGANVIVKNVIGTSPSQQNYLALAQSSLEGNNFKEAYDYYNKVLEQDATNAEAWFGKAVSAGGMTHISDIRFDEMVVLFENAIKNFPSEKQEDVRKKAAIEINKAVMNVISNMRAGGEFLLNPKEGGGFSISIGNIMYDAKHLAEQSLKAMETAHEWMPENKEISDNLDNLQKKMGNLSAIPNKQNLNFQQGSINVPRKKRSSCFIKLIFFAVIIIAGYLVVKNYLIKEKTLNNLISNSTGEEKTKPVYTIAYMTSQNGTACVSVLTDVSSDKTLMDINKEVIDKYYSKFKMIYVNYFTDKGSAVKNSNLQFKNDKDWIINHASSINLEATMEYDEKNQASKFYKYVDGKTTDVIQNN